MLKDHCDARTRLAVDVKALRGRLAESLDATVSAVQRRSVAQIRVDLRNDRNRVDSSEMGHSKNGDRAESRERQLEAAMWRRWGRTAPSVVEPTDLWAGLTHVQLPLFNKRKREGWGHIDLLGITSSKEPLVIELKAGNSANTPVHSLLEACAYAVSLRNNWHSYREAMDGSGLALGFAVAPANFPVAVVAEPAYWSRWAAAGELGKDVRPEAWGGIRLLTQEISARGFPVSFGTIEAKQVTPPEFAPESLRIQRFAYPAGAPTAG